MNRRPLAKIAAEIATLLKRETKQVIEIGDLLAEAKEQLNEHGRWLPWLSENFALSIRTAQRYLAASAFAAKYDTVSHLPLTVSGLHALIEADNAGHSEAVEAVLSEAKGAWVNDFRVWSVVASLSASRAPPPAPPTSDERIGEDPSPDGAEDDACPSDEAGDEEPEPAAEGEGEGLPEEEPDPEDEPEPDDDRPPPTPPPSLNPRQSSATGQV